MALCCLICSCQVFAKNISIGVNERDIYRFQDADGAWYGKDIDLVKAVFRRTSHTFQIYKIPWPRVLESMKSGTIDMTLAALNLPERREYALFSKSVYRYSHYMLFANKNKLHLFGSATSLEELVDKDVLIGALRGAVYSTRYHNLLNNEGFKKEIVEIGHDQSMVSFALKGRVDAYIDSEIEGKHYLREQPAFGDNIVPLFRITSDEEAGSNLMFSKKTISPEIVAEFDEALLDLHRSGEYEAISQKYVFSTKR